MRLVTVTFLLLLSMSAVVRAEIKIVTSIKPLALLINDIGGEFVQVTTLVPNAGSIHHYSMRVSDRVAVEQADMLVVVGAGLEPFSNKLSGLKNTYLLSMDQLEGIETFLVTNEGNHSHGHVGTIDPHLWLSPANSAQLARALSHQLGERLPNKKTYFEQRLQIFLQAKDHILKDNSIPNHRPYFAYHNAFAYLLTAFGIELQGVLTNVNESRLGMRSLYQVKRAVQEAPGACVLVQHSARQMSEKILGEIKYAEIDVLADRQEYNAYSDYLAAMLNAINDC